MNDALKCSVPAAVCVESEVRAHYVCLAHQVEVFAAYFHEGHTPTLHTIEDTRPHICGDIDSAARKKALR